MPNYAPPSIIGLSCTSLPRCLVPDLFTFLHRLWSLTAACVDTRVFSYITRGHPRFFATVISPTFSSSTKLSFILSTYVESQRGSLLWQVKESPCGRLSRRRLFPDGSRWANFATSSFFCFSNLTFPRHRSPDSTQTRSPMAKIPEMLHTRYSAVTCDPDDFARSGYSLRQFESKRTTEIFIVITMYNVSRISGVQAFVMTPWNFRKMKFYSAGHCMGSCGIYLSCARAKTRRRGGVMDGRK